MNTPAKHHEYMKHRTTNVEAGQKKHEYARKKHKAQGHKWRRSHFMNHEYTGSDSAHILPRLKEKKEKKNPLTPT